VTDPLSRLSAALADRYRIERELGQGGMATVYLAEDLKHHRKVAIKVLKPDLAAVLGADRFVQEIATTAALQHPHILTLFDSGEADGFLYYVMPYIEGESLRDRLDREKQLPLDDALAIAREVADALSYAHAHGVVHRDIKPENILLADGHATVADFGIAKAVSEAGAARLTATGMSVGTPMYMSPEQAAGDPNLDGRSDLYSLACVLYEMLAGQPPFSGPTAASVAHQHLTADARPVSQMRPAVPAAISDMLARALAKNPADRFSPAAQFAAALAPLAGTAAPAPRGPSRTVIGVGVAAVLVAVAATVLLMRNSDNQSAVAVGRTMQVTRDPGLEVDPALSPDGSSLAYASGPTNAMQIYVRQVSGGRPIALTSDTTRNYRWPRWSPDGSLIAYQADDGIYGVPALGGAPRRLTRFGQDSVNPIASGTAPITGFDWSPDGTRIAFTSGSSASSLTIVPLGGGTPVTMAIPGESSAPAWSPDGRTVAIVAGNVQFVFGAGYFGNVGASAIWLIPLDGSSPTALTSDHATSVSPQWSPDGRSLFWISDRDGARDVYQQRVRTDMTPAGEPRRVTTGVGAQGLSLSRHGMRMAYSRLNIWTGIWSLPVPARGPVSIRGATPVSTGNETTEDIDVSPDGHWLVFDSDRSGNSELYVMPAGGGEARQITDHPAGDFSGDWSPDGRRVAFHSLRNGNRDIYTVEADGTGLRQWTSTPDEEIDVDWAPDGETVLYEVVGDRHGFATLRLTDGARREFFESPIGDFAHWSPDGRTIVYHSADGLRLRDMASGAETLAASNAADGSEAFYAAWSPDGTLLYYLARSPAGWAVRVAKATGGPSRVLVAFDDPTRQHAKYGFATDGRTFYFTLGSPESDIYVADLESTP